MQKALRSTCHYLVPRNPGILQLYSAATPNGIKIAALLEELREIDVNFHYEPHTINITDAENKTEDFLNLSPTGKIPLIIDPHGPGGKEVSVFESGAILQYLAEKRGELIPRDPLAKLEVVKWLFWGSTGLSPQMKIFGFYYRYCPHNLPYCISRYSKECHRLFGVLEHQLSTHNQHWIVGDTYTIADISIWPWIYGLVHNYGDAVSAVFQNFTAYPRVGAWYERCISRRASQRSVSICQIKTPGV